MQALGIIHHVFLSGLLHGFLGLFKLSRGGERRLVGEIILAVFHDLHAERSALGGHGSGCHHHGFLVLEHLVLALGRNGLRVGLDEEFNLLGVGIPDILERSASFCQRIAHAVDMAVVKMGHGKDKLAGFYNRFRLAFGCIIHAVSSIHGSFLLKISSGSVLPIMSSENR